MFHISLEKTPKKLFWIRRAKKSTSGATPATLLTVSMTNQLGYSLTLPNSHFTPRCGGAVSRCDGFKRPYQNTTLITQP